MRRIILVGAVIALCAPLIVSLQSCTVIGLSIGAAADARNGTGGPGLLMSVQVGRPVTLTLWNGRVLQGRFAGWSRDSSAAFASTDSIAPVGAMVRLQTGSGEIQVPTESIAKVEISVSRGKIGGALVGLAADVMVVTTVRSALRPHSTNCGSPGISWF
jgi:hypothetical protein